VTIREAMIAGQLSGGWQAIFCKREDGENRLYRMITTHVTDGCVRLVTKSGTV